jgi:hypothetical protein
MSFHDKVKAKTDKGFKANIAESFSNSAAVINDTTLLALYGTTAIQQLITDEFDSPQEKKKA